MLLGYALVFDVSIETGLGNVRKVIGDLFSPTSMFYPYNEIPGRTTMVSPSTTEATAKSLLENDVN
jgi:hypothetical protein